MLTKQEALPVFKEEIKKFGLEDKVIDFRIGGYPKDFHPSYTEYNGESYFITIDHRVGNNLKKFRRQIRHQFFHIKKPEHRLLNEILAYLTEYFPLEKLYN